jgi:hypothetical protein
MYGGSELTVGYAFTPNTNVQAIAVRGYSTDRVSIWTDGGTFLTSQSLAAFGSWAEAPLAVPIALSAGTTYRVCAHVPVGTNIYCWTSSWPTIFTNGTVGQNFYCASGDVFPLSVLGVGEGPLVDLRYQVIFSNSVALNPTFSGAFVNGVWNGNITITETATNVVLKADDGAGHVALSNPFNLIPPFQLLSPWRSGGGQFQCTVFSPQNQKVGILASSNLENWSVIATLTNTTGTTRFTDPTSGLDRRFYRAQPLP